MKLIGNLKKQIENESTKEGRKKLIEKAGMKLTDDKLEKVSGGYSDIDYGDYDICAWNEDGSGNHEWEYIMREDGSYYYKCKYCELRSDYPI